MKISPAARSLLSPSLPVLLVFALSLLGAAGCSKKQIKPVPEGAVYYRDANRLIQALREGYTQKDPDIIRAVSTYKGYEEIAPSLGKFDSVSLAFTMKWIDATTPQTMDVTVAWEGVWTKGGQKDSESGTAVFELTGSPPQFNAVLSGNPFIYPK
ncbi:MAG: hypothetical protein M0Z58_02460 [Nitrospiraceae bacterium]|nr:hypothetical protein [Nitrospiraceae bacterium]